MKSVEEAAVAEAEFLPDSTVAGSSALAGGEGMIGSTARGGTGCLPSEFFCPGT